MSPPGSSSPAPALHSNRDSDVSFVLVVDVYPSSVVFRGCWGLWGQRGAVLRESEPCRVLRDTGRCPQAPGTAPASSRTVPGSELPCFVSWDCWVRLGRGRGFVCCLEIMFYFIHSSSLACFLSIFSNFYRIKFCFFTRTLPSVAFVQPKLDLVWFLVPEPQLCCCSLQSPCGSSPLL